MTDERPRPGGLFNVDLGGDDPIPDSPRAPRKATVALDGGPAHGAERGGGTGPQPPVSPPRTPVAPITPSPFDFSPVRASSAPTKLPAEPRFVDPASRTGPEVPYPIRPPHIPPPLPERTVIIAPEIAAAEVSEHSATPNTGDPPLGAAAWEGAGNDDSEIADLTEEDLCGVVVASHRLESRLGGGGFADVYVGRHEFLARVSAVKLLRRSLAASETTRRRFQREAEVLAALGHPNVVRLIDYGVLPSGRPFLVTELVEGRTLRQRLDSGEPIPPEVALEWTKQLARGLAALHALGVVHRDLKPTNVMVSNTKNELKILDLGIARWLEPGDRTRLTEAGRLLGTPKYSAPEQLLDPASAGPPADLYALGSILFEMLAGEAPFWGAGRGDGRGDVMAEKRARAPAPPPGNTGLESIAVALLEPDPERRIGTAAELLARLDEIQIGVATQVLASPLATQIIPTSSVASMPGAPVMTPSLVKPRGASPSRVWALAGGAAVLAFVVGVGTTVLVMRGGGADVVQVPLGEAADPVAGGAAPGGGGEAAVVAVSPAVGAAVGAVAEPSGDALTEDDAPEAVDEATDERAAVDEPDRRRRVVRPTPRKARDSAARDPAAASRDSAAPARVIAEPSRAMTARGEIDGALAGRGLTAQDLSALVAGEALSAWRASLAEDDARIIDATTRVLLRAIQDAPITAGVVEAQIRRVLAAIQTTTLPKAQLQKIEDRCFQLKRDLTSATALRREEIAREVTQMERRLRQ